MYDLSPSPAQTIDAGTRVIVRHNGFAYGAQRMVQATIIDYATPSLKENQVWSRESYFVRFGNDAPNTRRVFSVEDIIEVI